MNLKLIAVLFFVTLSFTITNSFAEDQITIQTDKDSYSQGELIDLTGKVNGASNQLVAIEAKDSGGNSILVRTIQTDANGNFELKFKIPPTAKSGSVNIVANAQVSGNTLTGSKTVSQSTSDNSQSISTSPQTYQVTFTESGLQQSCWFWIFGCSLPNWSITLDGNTQTSTSTSITFDSTNSGTYSYSVKTPSGYSAPPTNPLQVNGNVDQTIVFVKNQ